MKRMTMNHAPVAAAYSLIGFGLVGAGEKLAAGGFDLASISATIGAATAFIMATCQVVPAVVKGVKEVIPVASKAITDVIDKWREARANPVPPPAPPVPPSPEAGS